MASIAQVVLIQASNKTKTTKIGQVNESLALTLEGVECFHVTNVPDLMPIHVYYVNPKQDMTVHSTIVVYNRFHNTVKIQRDYMMNNDEREVVASTDPELTMLPKIKDDDLENVVHGYNLGENVRLVWTIGIMGGQMITDKLEPWVSKDVVESIVDMLTGVK